MEEGGATITDFPEAEREAWANALPNIAMDWAKALDEQGLAGTEVVETYMRKLEEAGAELPRDWSQE